MLGLLYAAGGDWTAFKTIAQKLTSDAEMTHAFIALANLEPNLFLNSKDKVVKLTAEGVQEATKLDSALVATHQVAAKAVHKYANQLKPHVLPIIDVGRGRLVLDRYLHAVAVDLSDDDLRLADDTPVTFKSTSGHSVYGKVAGIARDEAVVYVAFGNEILPVDLPAHLEVDTRMQWTTIANRLEQQKATPLLFEALQTKKNGGGLQSLDSSNLAMQLEHLPAPWAKLLWGPPGPGKTFCVGRLVAGLLAGTSPDRVLVVAPSNVAVDAATLEVLAALRTKPYGAATIAARRVVRYGYPRDAKVLAERELFGSVQLEALSKSIEKAFAEIRHLRRRCASEFLEPWSAPQYSPEHVFHRLRWAIRPCQQTPISCFWKLAVCPSVLPP